MLDYFYAFCERYGCKLNSWDGTRDGEIEQMEQVIAITDKASRHDCP